MTSGDTAVLAAIRSTPDETLLVVVNASDKPVAAPVLSLAVGPLCGSPNARFVVGDGTARPLSPAVLAGGGFSGYRPLDSVPPQSVSVIALAP